MLCKILLHKDFMSFELKKKTVENGRFNLGDYPLFEGSFQAEDIHQSTQKSA